jgi:hypothetical protein
MPSRAPLSRSGAYSFPPSRHILQCRKQELNLHGLPHRVLDAERLPFRHFGSQATMFVNELRSLSCGGEIRTPDEGRMKPMRQPLRRPAIWFLDAIHPTGSSTGIRTWISAVNSRLPCQLGYRGSKAAEKGIEPLLYGPEPCVLPLEHSAITCRYQDLNLDGVHPAYS